MGIQIAPWLLPKWNMTQRLDSVAKIVDYNGPLLQSHSTDDKIIPIALARKLYAAAPGRKHFVTVAGGDHTASWPDEFTQQFAAFLDYVYEDFE